MEKDLADEQGNLEGAGDTAAGSGRDRLPGVRRAGICQAAAMMVAVTILAPTVAVAPEDARAGAAEPSPTLQLAPADVALTIDGVPYPRAVVEGYLAFRATTLTGDHRTFYEWEGLLRLFDTLRSAYWPPVSPGRQGSGSPRRPEAFSRYTRTWAPTPPTTSCP